MTSKPKWKSIGKRQINQVTTYREFESKQLDECSSNSRSLAEWKSQIEQWIYEYGKDTELDIAATTNEMVAFTLSRPVHGSKETTER